MKSIMAAVALAIGLLLAANVSSNTIYTWTDKNGVQRFSNDPPPKGVENFQQFETQAMPPDTSGADNKRRPSYDQMVQRASQAARQQELQGKAEAAARAAKEKRLAEKRRQAKIQSERNRLLKQIDAIKNRAVSPTFPMGMKKAQIDKIRKQIAELEKNPDTGASPRQDNAAESKSGY
jgi:Domain of unknown function (DUF4124)